MKCPDDLMMLRAFSPISNIDILAYPMALFRRRFSICPYPYLPRVYSTGRAWARARALEHEKEDPHFSES